MSKLLAYYIFSVTFLLFSITNASSETEYSIDQKRQDILQIQVNVNKEPFFVKCNHGIENGGWTVVLHRDSGNQSFNCKWKDCVKGFGNINREFFIGLERLHDITSYTLHEVMFIMEDFEDETRIARYDAFAIEDEHNDFLLYLLGNFSGNAGESFYHQAGYKFATIDRDYTNFCCQKRDAPGWYNYCSDSNIFGNYLRGAFADDGSTNYRGMHWSSFRGRNYALKRITMMIRPIN